MGALANRVRAKWGWVKENPLFWGNIVLILGTIVIAFVIPAPIVEAGPSDFRLKTWGLFLQLIGVRTVWHDLASAGKTFGKSGFLTPTWTWLKAGFLKRNNVITTICASTENSFGKARIKMRRNLPSDSPIEQRVEAIEYNLQTIDEDITAAFKEIDKRTGELQDQIKEESQRRNAAHSALEDSLKDALVGNYAVLSFGVVWLVVGMVISTLASEIAKIAAGQWNILLKTL